MRPLELPPKCLPRARRPGWARRRTPGAGPEAFLGPGRAETGLLLELLDAGERLMVHRHADRAFARPHVGLEYGRTEGRLESAGGALPLRRGSTVLIPYAAGPARLAGDLSAHRALGPAA